MSDVAGACLCAVVIVVVFTVWVFGVFAIFGEMEMQKELQQRGLKEYDKQTGRLIWAEKAGGEKGGDK